MKKTVVVVGGGISGLTAAYVLAKKGYDIVLIEKSDSVGGLAKTFSHKGYLLDYGPHNFHTGLPRVLSFVRNELAITLNRIKISSSKLYFMGRIVDYPLKIADAIKILDPVTASLCFYDYLITRLSARLGLRSSKEDSFEAWIVNRFGRRLYNLYFGPYVKKVWGIPGTELNVTVAKQRIPEPSLFALLFRVVTGVRIFKKHTEDPSTVESYYPPMGIGVISEKLAEGIRSMGGRIELNSSALEIKRGAAKTIQYSKGGEKLEQKWDYIINTVPLNTFCSMIRDGEAGAAVKESIEKCGYRSLVLLYMFLKIERVFDSPWVYFNDRDNTDLIFNRVYEVGGFSKEMISGGKGAVCLEITCRKGDELWNTSDEGIFDKCIEYFEKRGYLKRDQVEEYITVHLDDVYPVFKVGYIKHVENLMNYIMKNDDMFSIGRQGLFAYANMDHCIDMGLRLERLFRDDNSAGKAEYFSLFNDYVKTEK